MPDDPTKEEARDDESQAGSEAVAPDPREQLESLYEHYAASPGALFRLSRVEGAEGEETYDALYLGEPLLDDLEVAALWGGGRYLFDVLSGPPGGMVTRVSVTFDIEGEPKPRHASLGLLLPTEEQEDRMAESFVWHRFPLIQTPGVAAPPLLTPPGLSDGPCGPPQARPSNHRVAMAMGAALQAYGLGAVLDDMFRVMGRLYGAGGKLDKISDRMGSLAPVLMPFLGDMMAGKGGHMSLDIPESGPGQFATAQYQPGKGPSKEEFFAAVDAATKAGIPMEQLFERFSELFPEGTFQDMGNAEATWPGKDESDEDDPDPEAHRGRGQPGDPHGGSEA